MTDEQIKDCLRTFVAEAQKANPTEDQRAEKRQMTPEDDAVGRWLSAAMGDADTCQEMLEDIEDWFNQFRP